MASVSDYYTQAYGELGDKYQNQVNTVENNYNTGKSTLQNAYNTDAEALGKANDQAKQEAYINYMKAQRDTPVALAAQGITGGMTETTYAQLLKTLENSRNASQGSYNTQLSARGKSLENDLYNLQATRNSSLTDIDTARDSDAWSRAKTLYEAEVQRQQFEAQQEAQRQQFEEQKRQYDEQLKIKQDQLDMQKQEWDLKKQQLEQQLAEAQAAAEAKVASKPSAPTGRRLVKTLRDPVGRTGVKTTKVYSDGTTEVSYNYGQGTEN